MGATHRFSNYACSFAYTQAEVPGIVSGSPHFLACQMDSDDSAREGGEARDTRRAS